MFETATLDLPKALAADSCVISKLSINFLMPFASSIIFKSSLCIFSISAIAKAEESGISFIKTGIFFMPAFFDACQRLSPAIISYFSLLFFLTNKGCIIPCSFIDSANSSRASSFIICLG